MNKSLKFSNLRFLVLVCLMAGVSGGLSGMESSSRIEAYKQKANRRFKVLRLKDIEFDRRGNVIGDLLRVLSLENDNQLCDEVSGKLEALKGALRDLDERGSEEVKGNEMLENALENFSVSLDKDSDDDSEVVDNERVMVLDKSLNERVLERFISFRDALEQASRERDELESRFSEQENELEEAYGIIQSYESKLDDAVSWVNDPPKSKSKKKARVGRRVKKRAFAGGSEQ